MKKYTYHRSRIERTKDKVEVKFTGETIDHYFADGESVPDVIFPDTPNNRNSRSSVGYSKSYVSNYEETFGGN